MPQPSPLFVASFFATEVSRLRFKEFYALDPVSSVHSCLGLHPCSHFALNDTSPRESSPAIFKGAFVREGLAVQGMPSFWPQVLRILVYWPRT